jgi:hypothetical protein
LRQCECSRDEMLGDFYCTDIKRNMEELCRDDDDVDNAEVDSVVDNATEVNDYVSEPTTVTTEDTFDNEIDVDEIPLKGRASLLNSTLSLFPVICLLKYFIRVRL